jgi:hypothetical protein
VSGHIRRAKRRKGSKAHVAFEAIGIPRAVCESQVLLGGQDLFLVQHSPPILEASYGTAPNGFLSQEMPKSDLEVWIASEYSTFFPNGRGGSYLSSRMRVWV